MKKLIIIALEMVLTSITMCGLYGCIENRTPETVLKSMFGISLKDFDYIVDTFEEQGNFSDWQLIAVFKFNKLTQENIDYLKEFNPQPLPIPDTIPICQKMSYNKIPRQFFKADTGYYLYRPDKDRPAYRDFKIFIIDTKKKVAVLYFQHG